MTVGEARNGGKWGRAGWPGAVAVAVLVAAGCEPAQPAAAEDDSTEQAGDDSTDPTPEDADQDGYPSDADCNDADGSVHPGATDGCGDCVDNNCDGMADPGCPTTNPMGLGCSPTRWQIGEAGSWLGAVWTAGGRADDAGAPNPDLVIGVASPRWDQHSAVLQVRAPFPKGRWELPADADSWCDDVSAGQAATAVAWTRDVDGDGLPEIAVGAYAAGDRAGAVYILASGSSPVATLDDAYAVYRGVLAEDWCGFTLASAGDLDGDGLAELLVGCPGSSWLGSRAGAVSIVREIEPGEHDVNATAASMYAEIPDQYAGTFLAGAGDVDGDGYGDLLVGATGVPAYGGPATTYLVNGPVEDGPQHLSDVAAATIVGAGYEETLTGAPALGASDLDGDGYDDLVLGTATWTGTWSPKATVFYGPVQGDLTTANADAVFAASLGISLDEEWTVRSWITVSMAGDMNGDGYGDLAVGDIEADQTGAGTVRIYLGGPERWAGDVDVDSSAFTLVGEAEVPVEGGQPRGDGAGAFLAPAGDVDGDGRDDLLVGTQHHHSDPEIRGFLYLVPGTAGPWSAER